MPEFVDKVMREGKPVIKRGLTEEHDLVSEDESIVVEVKSGKGIVGNDNRNSAGISTCFQDCYLLHFEMTL